MASDHSDAKADPGDPVALKTKYPYLAGLNAAQYKAVTADPAIPLQILAGPGSGKTRVLTSRVAYLVQHHGLFPHQITAVTFTNKAASEMRKRLDVLLGAKLAGGLVLGTFHATCARFLRRYAQLIGLNNNFAIADADDCKKIMSGLLKAKAEFLEGARMSLKDRAVLSDISKAKARGESPEAMAIRAAQQNVSSSTDTLNVVAELYIEYEAAMREANSLDFDDLLVFGLKLFTDHPNILGSCQHILVDEFQDTNTTQYQLMRCFAKAHGGVTVVGDPDQSIYSWRAAEVENLNRMNDDFSGTQAIYLEENYRSTGSILSAAHSVVSQDKTRIQKSLFTSHPQSTAVTLKQFSTPVIEASFISTEIKRLIAYSGGVLNYGDFAILLRYNALSRVIESALQKDSVPNRIVGGHKFFERMEVKDLLAYLQLAENPNFTPAFVRVVNVPRRAIGDKTVADLLAAAKRAKVTPMELCERMVDGDRLPEGIKPAIKNKIAAFVGVVRKLRRAAAKGMDVADLLRLVIEKTSYEDYLRLTQQDFDSRWENVQELISFTVTVAEEQARQASSDADNPTFTTALSAATEAVAMEVEEADTKPLHPMFRRMSTSSSRSRSTSLAPEPPSKVPRQKATRANGRGKAKVETVKEEVIDLLSSDEDEPKRPGMKRDESDLTPMDELEDPTRSSGNGSAAGLSPLSFFLQTSMLSTDTDNDNQDDKANTPKVTITTVHSAKGLEWPVVFIPAVEQGTFPSYRCVEPNEIDEERRLLYVAMTRAQLFLSMTYSQFRMMGGEENDKTLSEFVALSQKKDANTFSSDLPDIKAEDRQTIAKMLGRTAPDESGMKDMIMKHVRAAPPLSMWDAPEPRDRQFNRFARREVTKAARAAEYWSSEADEYALPGQGGSSSGFRSARQLGGTGGSNGYADRDHRDRERDRLSQPVNVKREVKPPPVLLKSNHHFPDLPKFSFGAPDEEKRESGLGSWTSASSSSLAMMKNLGLPGEEEGAASPRLSAGGSSPLMGASPKLGAGAMGPAVPGMRAAGFMGMGGAGGVGVGGGLGLGGLQARAAGGLAGLKGLGMPEIGQKSASASAGAGGVPAAGAKLAQGTKRLGMGRPMAWGSASATKKPRRDA